MKKYISYASFLTLLLSPISAFAASCSNYPAVDGVEVIETLDGSVKIKSTALATVPINDAELYLDAIEEAELKAKAKISKFLSEEIIDQCLDEKTNTLSIDVTGEGDKSVNYKKVKKTLCSVKNKSSSLLRGAIRISDCYTPGKYVMVTVGIKQGTINKAKKLTNQIEKDSYLNQKGNFVPINGKSNIDGFFNF